MKYKFQFYYATLISCFPVALMLGVTREVMKGTMSQGDLIGVIVFALPFLIYLRYNKRIKSFLRGQEKTETKKRLILGVVMVLIVIVGLMTQGAILMLIKKGVDRKAWLFYLGLLVLLIYLYSLIVIWRGIYKMKKSPDTMQATNSKFKDSLGA